MPGSSNRKSYLKEGSIIEDIKSFLKIQCPSHDKNWPVTLREKLIRMRLCRIIKVLKIMRLSIFKEIKGKLESFNGVGND